MVRRFWDGRLFDQRLTVLDFAGGIVVRICAAVTGPALVLFAGRTTESTHGERAHRSHWLFRKRRMR